jgi:hypothetical protein
MKDLIVRILFKADDKAVKSQLSKTEKEAKKSANKISGEFKKAFRELATSLAGLGLARVFKSAIDDAARLEQSLLKLQTAAKNTGQDFNTIREGLQRLRSEGVLSFQVITEASAQLLQQGFRADQVEPFLRALRNIGALENTVGDTNLAIQSFIRAISTNSLELVDNLSPALRKVVLDLGGFNEIAKNATKQQEFFNITLERGNKLAPAFAESVATIAGKQEQFATNTEKLSESFGKVLIPAFEVFLGIGSDIVVGLTNAINGFNSLERALLAASSAATALGLSLAFIAGPYVALGAAATAFLTVLIASRQELNEVNDLVDETGNKVKNLEDKLSALDKIKSSDSQKALLIEQLRTATSNYNNALIKRIELERNSQLATKASLSTEKERLDFERTQARNIIQSALPKGLTKQQQDILTKGSEKQVENLVKKIKNFKLGSFQTTPEILLALDTLAGKAAEQAAILDALKKLKVPTVPSADVKEQKLTEIKPPGGGTDGARFGEMELQAFRFDVTALDRYRSALKDVNEQLEESTNTEQDRKRAEIARQAALANAFSDTSFEIDAMSSSIDTLGDASASTSEKIQALGSGLIGLGGTLGTLLNSPALASQFGVAGAAVGLIGSIGGLFENIFSRQTNETNSILDQQLELQREQYSLQRQQAQVEDKYFQDRLEIIRLEARQAGEDPNQAIATAITDELRNRFGFTGDINVESLKAQRELIKSLGERSVSAQARLQEIGGLSDLDKPNRLRLIANEFGINLGSLTRVSDIESSIVLALNDIITGRTLEEAKQVQDLLQQGISAGLTTGGAPPPTTLQQVQPRGFSFLDVSRGGLQTALGFAPSRAVQMISGAGVPGQIGSLTVATEAMKTTEEKMLDTLDGQLLELKKQTDILSKLTGQDVTIAVLNAISAGQARSL